MSAAHVLPFPSPETAEAVVDKVSVQKRQLLMAEWLIAGIAREANFHGVALGLPLAEAATAIEQNHPDKARYIEQAVESLKGSRAPAIHWTL